MFVAAVVNTVESFEITDCTQEKLSDAHESVCSHVTCDVLSSFPNSSGDCMDCGFRERCRCSAPGHNDTGGRLPQSGTSAASAVNPKFAEVDLVSTCYNREGSSDSCGQPDDANENYNSNWIDTCPDKRLQVLQTADTISQIELWKSTDRDLVCPVAPECEFVCTLTEQIHDSSKFCAEIDLEPPP